MNKEEARKVIGILMSADGGCYQCTHELIRFFIEDFPQFRGLAIKAWEERSGMKFSLFDLPTIV